FGGGEHDDEDGEQLAVVTPAAVAREGHIVDVGRVEDELDAHEDADGVPACDDAEETEREEDRGEDHEVRERDLAHPFTSLRDTTIAPMSAASRTTEATSKGNTQVPRKASPMPAVVGSGGPGCPATQRPARATRIL